MGKEQGPSVVSPQHLPLSGYPSPHHGLPVELLSLRKGTKSSANQSPVKTRHLTGAGPECPSLSQAESTP